MKNTFFAGYGKIITRGTEKVGPATAKPTNPDGAKAEFTQADVVASLLSFITSDEFKNTLTNIVNTLYDGVYSMDTVKQNNVLQSINDKLTVIVSVMTNHKFTASNVQLGSMLGYFTPVNTKLGNNKNSKKTGNQNTQSLALTIGWKGSDPGALAELLKVIDRGGFIKNNDAAVSAIEAIRLLVEAFNDIPDIEEAQTYDNLIISLDTLNKQLYKKLWRFDISYQLLDGKSIVKQLNGLSEIFDLIINTGNKLKSTPAFNYKAAIETVKGFVTIMSLLPQAKEGAAMANTVIPLLIKAAGEVEKLITAVSKIKVPKTIKADIKELMWLIVGVTAVMLLAAVSGGFVLASLKNILGFSVAFILFSSSIMLFLLMAKPLLTVSIKSAQDLAMLVGVIGMTMIIGALFFMIPGMAKSALAFALLYGIFSFAIIGIGLTIRLIGKEAIAGARDLAILVGVSAITLIIGALFIMIPGMAKAAIEFTVLLGAFIGAMALIYFGVSKWLGPKVLSDMREFTILVAISAAALIIGGLFMLIPGMPLAALEFAGILAGFILGVSAAYALASKLMGNGQALANMYAFSLLVAVSAGALIAGAMVMNNIPNALEKISTFTGALLVLVGGMVGISILANKVKPTAIVAIGVISACILASSVAMRILSEINVSWELVATAYIMCAIVGVFTSLVIAVGAVASTGVGTVAMALGIAAIAGIAGSILMLAEAFHAIVDALVLAKQVDVNSFANIANSIINGIAAIMTNPGTLLLLLPGTMLAIAAVTEAGVAMAIMISSLGKAVGEIASLNLPIYNGTEVVGYRQLNDSDFALAASNTSLIITTLGQAIMSVYEENPDMFQVGLTDWLMNGGFIGSLMGANETPFVKVVRACTEMSAMISKIGEAVGDIATLKVPIYKGTEVVGYRQLNDNDFSLAGDNISTIITTLGGAITKTYKEHKEMFDGDTWDNLTNWAMNGFFLGSLAGIKSDSPFIKVIKASELMSGMISKVGKSVGEIANLSMTLYDANGKEIGKKQLDNGDFTQAGENVKTILSTMCTAINETYKNLHLDQSFEQWLGNGGFLGALLGIKSDSPFILAIQASNKLTEVISNVASSVKDISNLTIPTDWDKKTGKPIAYKTLTPEDFNNVGTNVNNILTTVASAISGAYENLKNSGDLDEDGPVAKAMEIIGNSTGIISDIVDALVKLGSGQIPSEWKDGKVVDYINFTADKADHIIENMKSVITKVLTAIGSAIKTVVDKNPQLFNDGEESPGVAAANAVASLGGIVTNIADAIVAFGSGTPEYNDDGKVIGSKPLSPAVIKQAQLAISGILTAIGNTIVNTVVNNEEYFADGEGSKGMIAAKAIGNMSSIVSSVAEAIVLIATGTPAKYENGQKVSDGVVITDAAIVTAKQRISEILTTIGSAIIETVEGHESWFNKGNNSIGIIASTALGNMANIVTAAAEAIVLIAGGKPATYKDGKKTSDGVKITPATIAMSQLSVVSMLTAIGTAFQSVLDNNPSWFGGGNNSPIVIVSKAFDNMSDIVSSIANSVVALAGGVVKDTNGDASKILINASTIGIATKTLQSILTCIADTFIKVYNGQTTDGTVSADLKDMFTGGNNSPIIIISTAFDKMTAVLDKMTDLILRLIENNKVNSAVLGGTNSTVAKTVSGILDILAYVPYMLTSIYDPWASGVSNYMMNYIRWMAIPENYKDTLQGLTYGGSVARKILSIGNTLNNDFTKMQGVNITGIHDFIFGNNTNTTSGMLNILIGLSSILNAKSNVFGLFGNKLIWEVMLDTADNSEDIIYSIDETYKILNKLIANENLTKNSNNLATFGTTVNVIRTLLEDIAGIDIALNNTPELINEFILGITSNIDDINASSLDNLQKLTKELGDYVKVVDAIDMDKVNSLASLTNSMNRLAYQMGSIDKLTEAIADKLATTLKFLADQLVEAKNTINKTEEIQKQRHTKIDSSINKIKKLMENTIKVQVDVAADQTPSPSPTTSGGVPSDAGSYGSGASNIQSSTGITATNGSSTGDNLVDVDQLAAGDKALNNATLKSLKDKVDTATYNEISKLVEKLNKRSTNDKSEDLETAVYKALSVYFTNHK